MKEYLNRYILYLQHERRLSRNSLASYERDLSAFLAFANELGLAVLESVHRHHLSSYMSKLKSEGKKASTLSRHIVSIKGFFHFLVVEGMIVHNPAVYMEAPKQEKSLPQVLSVEQASLLIESPDSSSAAGKRDKAMLELLYATGIRVSELVSLDVEHINLQLGFVQCTGSGMKERIVPFGRLAGAALVEYIQSGRDELLTARDSESALFLNHLGTRLTRQGFWKTIKKYAKEAGIAESITPHTLRHSVASHMLDNGADIRTVQELLGHVDLSSTLKYSQLPKARIREAYKSSHPRA